MIKEEDLIDGAYYIGDGRFLGLDKCVAFWNLERKQFVGLGTAFGYFEANTAIYGDRGFTPIKLVE